MDKAAQMYALIEEYYASGSSMRDFTQLRGLSLSTFRYWIAKKKRNEAKCATGSFIPLSPKAAKDTDGLEIIYPNGVRILTGSQNMLQLRQLVKLF